MSGRMDAIAYSPNSGGFLAGCLKGIGRESHPGDSNRRRITEAKLHSSTGVFKVCDKMVLTSASMERPCWAALSRS